MSKTSQGQVKTNRKQAHGRFSLGIFLKILFILGLHKDFEKLASPERDKEGIYRETMRMPERVHSQKRL